MPSTRLSTLAMLLPLLTLGAAHAQEKIVINHSDDVQEPAGTVPLRQGQVFEIDLTHTYPDCFSYNFEAVKATPSPTGTVHTASADPNKKITEQTVPFRDITHDSSIGSYKITIETKDISDPDIKKLCDSLPQKPKTYTVNVTTYGWALGFAGAFTADKLTDPVFSLRAGTPPSGTGSTNGYFVEENKKAGDSFRLGSAAMIHLYHSDPNRWQLGESSISWAPLSFGLGVNGGSQTHYFLGTSLKFGDQAFLTAGFVFGPRKRLPDGLGIGSFTTDQNALSSLPTRNASAFFVGLSYTFISVSQDTFKSQFKQSTPSPSPKTGGEGGK